MHGVSNVRELSGWILPDGTWRSVPEWWHISALFDLRDEGHTSLTCQTARATLDSGDEAQIRDLAARRGFAKVSRGMLDAYSFTDTQLATLQDLLEICDLEAELTLLSEDGAQRIVSVARLLKLRRAAALFPAKEQQVRATSA